jgi:hypothetical protein
VGSSGAECQSEMIVLKMFGTSKVGTFHFSKLVVVVDVVVDFESGH